MNDIVLPKPQIDLKFPLMEAILKRRTRRKWKIETLSLQEASNILWCTCGQTKAATKRSRNRRTIPSACSSQIVKVYVALETGVYMYNESEHKLIQITDQDIRNRLGTQKMMKCAQFGLIYVADFNQGMGITKADYTDKMRAAGVETGCMSQNVYLYAASCSLSTVLLGLIDRDNLKQELKLDEGADVIYTQVVGKAV